MTEDAASPRVVVYGRLSGRAADRDAQLLAVRLAGYAVEQICVDHVLASTPARKRPALLKLIQGLRPGDMLVTASLDSLGRDASDIVATLGALRGSGVDVVCLSLGSASLTRSRGGALMKVLQAVADLDAQVLLERTDEGQARVRTWTGTTGRPPRLDLNAQLDIVRQRREGVSLAQLARQYGVSRAAIQRVEKRLNLRES